MRTLERPALSGSRSSRPHVRRRTTTLTPTRKTTVVGVLALALALVVAWFAVLEPRAADVTAVKQQRAATESANDSLRSQIAVRQAQEAQLPTLRKLSDALSGRFPATAEQAKLFAMITAAAASSDIAPQYVTNLTVAAPADAAAATTAALPGVATPIGRVAAQTVSMDVRATPAKIREFVANLEKLPRAFQVTSINLSTQTTAKGRATAPGGNQTAAISGQMFLMPTFVDPTRS